MESSARNPLHVFKVAEVHSRFDKWTQPDCLGHVGNGLQVIDRHGDRAFVEVVLASISQNIGGLLSIVFIDHEVRSGEMQYDRLDELAMSLHEFIER